MKLHVTILRVAALAIVLLGFACSSSNSPATKMYGYLDKMVTILEQNKADPDKAGTELSAYCKSIEGEVDKTIDAFEHNPIAAGELALKIAPLLERKAKLLSENAALGRNSSVGESFMVFDVLSMMGGKSQ
jgi:hypothetical protein